MIFQNLVFRRAFAASVFQFWNFRKNFNVNFKTCQNQSSDFHVFNQALNKN